MSKPAKLSPIVAINFLEILNEHQCPFTQYVDESYISELLLSPGEHRIRLLLWIFGEIHPSLDRIVNSQQLLLARATDLGVDKRVQILTGLGASFGLCRPADLDLIRGQTSEKKQVSFWKKLFGILKHSSSSSLSVNFRGDEEILKEITENENVVSDLSSQNIELLPHDLVRVLAYKPESVSGKHLTPKLIEEFEKELHTLSDVLADQQKKLGELERNVTYLQEDDKTSAKHISKSLILNLNDLDQMITTFEQVYCNTFSAFCNREPVQFGNLGPIIQIVCKQLSYIVNVFEKLGSVESNIEAITKCRDKLSNTSGKISNFVSLLDPFWSSSIEYFNELSETLTSHDVNPVGNKTDDPIHEPQGTQRIHDTICDISTIR